MATPEQPHLAQYMYLDKSHAQQGPAVGLELQYLLDQGAVTADTYIWTTGMKEWLPIKQTPLAQFILPKTTQQPPDAPQSKQPGNTNAPNAATTSAPGEPKAEPKTDSKAESTEETSKKKKKKKKRRKAPKTWIYITGIPKDATEQELLDHFSKCGFIQEDAIEGKPMLKLYRDETTGELKGDASICFVQEASVELALSIMDEAPLRLEKPKESKLSVTRATFNNSHTAEEDKGGTKRKKKDNTWDKRVKLRKLKLQQALSWNEEGLEDDFGLKIVVLKNLFDPKDIEDPTFRAELEESLMSECQGCGKVAKLTIVERNVEGVAIVKYDSARAAEKCVDLMKGRWFDKRQIEAIFWDGTTDYRVKASEEEEEKRIESFGDWLEGKAPPDEEDETH